MSNFFWNNKIIKYNSLNKDIYTDILIIGGGITGISILNELANSKYKITLIDKDRLINGITNYTTGKISYLQGNIYSKLYNNFNLNTAKLYYESQIDAINKILNNIKKYKIDCDIEKVKSIIYTKTNKNEIIKEKEILDKLNIKNKLIYNNLGLEVYDTYVFNPIKYLLGILNKINKFVTIYDYTKAIDIKYKNKLYITKTNKGIIKSKYVIIACHYPFFIKPLFIPLKTYIKREYVNVINMTKKYESIINIDDDLCSIRYYNNNLIYGSNKHELYNKINYKNNYIKSINDTYKIFNKKPYITWMNQDIVSNDYIPFIGKIKNNLYIATAYNGWGMTNGVLSSFIISEDILKRYS